MSSAKKQRCRVPLELLDVFQCCRRWAGQLVAESGSEERVSGCSVAIRSCLRNLAPLRAVALTAEAGDISKWSQVRKLRRWPTNGADIPAYCVLLIYRDLWALSVQADLSETIVAEIRERQLNLSAAIRALPLEDTVHATIALREDAKVQRRRAGPVPVPAPHGGALRL